MITAIIGRNIEHRCVGSMGEPLNRDGRGKEEETDNPEEMLEQIFVESWSEPVGKFGDKTVLSRAESRWRVPEPLVDRACQETVGSFVWPEH